MAMCKVFCVVLLVFTVSAMAGFYDELLSEEDRDFAEEEEERALAVQLRSLREKRIKAFECKVLNAGCGGIVPCCGNLHCYWVAGHSLTTEGKCVECIQRNQICQRDASCCTGLVCQKEKALYTDGRCDSPRAAGGSCHEDDQCASHNCRISVWSQITRKEGACA